MDNRRLSPRFSLMSSLTYRASGASHRGFLVSLSEGGCTLEAETVFALRDPVTLLFHLGLEATVIAVAIVRWTRDTRCGAEFLCMSADSHKGLRDWLTSRAISVTVKPMEK